MDDVRFAPPAHPETAPRYSNPRAGSDEHGTAAPGQHTFPRASDLTALTRLLQRIDQFPRLPGGRADDGIIPPPPELAAHVIRLVKNLPGDMRLPQPTVSEDGEIGLTWFYGVDRLDAIASPDGHLTWVSRIGGQFLDGHEIPLSADEFGTFNKALAVFYK